MIICKTELDTCKFIVSNLEVVESNITNFFSNSSISSIFPTSQIIEISSNWRVLPPWICWIIYIVSNSFAWELSWNHVMEDTKAISTTRVSSIVSKLTNSFVFWAYICICMWSDSMFLEIIPVTIAIRTTTMVIHEVVIWVSDPEAGRCLISVE